jgi:ABC-type nickel/cobalt efflux system permease component RcnA
LFWGIGHTLTLLAVAGTCLVLHATVPDRLASQLELAVGVMLVLLGAHVLYRLWRDRIHFHSHRHGSGPVHFHAHSHRDDPVPHVRSSHAHGHREGTPWRTLVIGLVHGMAGSAALVVLTASTLDSPWWGVAYILAFGVGTTLGMALLSAIIAAPITLTARSLTLANRGLQLAIGIATIAIGAMTVFELAPAALATGI